VDPVHVGGLGVDPSCTGCTARRAVRTGPMLSMGSVYNPASHTALRCLPGNMRRSSSTSVSAPGCLAPSAAAPPRCVATAHRACMYRLMTRQPSPVHVPVNITNLPSRPCSLAPQREASWPETALAPPFERSSIRMPQRNKRAVYCQAAHCREMGRKTLDSLQGIPHLRQPPHTRLLPRCPVRSQARPGQ